MHKERAFDGSCDEPSQQPWPCFEKVNIIEQGRAIGVLLREFDGSVSAIRIPIEQLAD
jgi:hypothetical protein